MTSSTILAINAAPTTVQFAKDGVWEKAWIIDLENSHPTDKNLQNYIEKNPFNHLEVEVILQGNTETPYILGLSYNDHLQTKNPLAFLQKFLQIVSTYTEFTSFIQELDQQFVGHSHMLQDDPDLIHIGIVNHWFSIGSCLIWKKGEPKTMNKLMLEERLQKKPEVVETTLNYQGMSFVYNSGEKTPGLCHWLKSPCTHRNKGVWELDRSLILQYLRDWTGFTE